MSLTYLSVVGQLCVKLIIANVFLASLLQCRQSASVVLTQSLATLLICPALHAQQHAKHHVSKPQTDINNSQHTEHEMDQNPVWQSHEVHFKEQRSYRYRNLPQ